jgi:hypothetical protein
LDYLDKSGFLSVFLSGIYRLTSGIHHNNYTADSQEKAGRFKKSETFFVNTNCQLPALTAYLAPCIFKVNGTLKLLKGYF